MNKTRKMTMMAMLCAIALVAVAVCRIPIIPAVDFITYDPKDIVLTIGGYLFGPVSALVMCFAVSFVEMFTLSTTGYIGFIMNFLSSAAFACTSTYFYKRKHSIRHAVFGLILGSVIMTAIMLLWNYIITPIYMGIPREQVVPLLIPAILPVNLLKGGINTALTLLLYKPIVTALRKANLIPQSENHSKGGFNAWGMAIGAFILLSCIVAVVLFNK